LSTGQTRAQRVRSSIAGVPIDDIAPLLDPTAPPRIMTWAQARRFGYTESALRHLVRTGRWQHILPRVYLTSDTLTFDDRLRAAVTFAQPGALLSGAAALCDLGLRSVSRPSSVLVLVPGNRAPRSVDWVRISPSGRPMSQALMPGPSRVTVARSTADLALELRREDNVRALVADVVRRDLCTVAELARELRSGPRRGSRLLREAIDEVGQGAWSAPEARAATLLPRARVPEFRQNFRIDLPNGRWFYVDFLWKELRAVLEIDSDTHHALTGDAERTADKHLALETLGFSVVHRTPMYVIRYPEPFVVGVHAWLAARTRELAIRGA
jgi:very-short-patch-repair endonuclease